MALIFADAVLSPAVTDIALSRSTALSSSQLTHIPIAQATGIAAKIAALRTKENQLS